MGCNGDREKGEVAIEEKWDYVVRLGLAGRLSITNVEYRTSTISSRNHAGRLSRISSSGSF